MASKISWELYRSFLGVLKEGSLSGAARALGVAQPTIGRHIAALEKSFGQALFTRSQAGFIPTDAALSLKSYAEAMDSTAAALERTAKSSIENAVSGTVRVTASDVISVEVLPSVIARLRELHPDLKIELAPSNRVQDLLNREADIAVRMVRPEQTQLIARQVGMIEVGLHAHKEYLARHGIPEEIADLRGHTVIGYDQESAYIRSLSKYLHGLKRDDFSLRTDSDLAQLALIRAGAGIGFCQVPIAKRNPELVRILPQYFSLMLETWVTMHVDLRNTPRYRITFNALVEGLQQHVGLP